MKIIIDSKYIILPVNHNSTKKRLEFIVNGNIIYDIDIELDYINPDHDYYLNVEPFIGTEIELMCVPEIKLQFRKSDIKPVAGEIYKEKYRPGYHFTAQEGWLNDPNGLVYYNGQYHMFYQHNPVGRSWGNMHWGHATSTDLVHWSEMDLALYPDELGTMFSGSAIVDKNNVSGLRENDNEVVLLFYTAAGGTSQASKGKHFTQCLAYSTDAGKTFKKYDKNPLIPEIKDQNRDPKVIYHKPSDTYVMALFLTGNTFALLSSKNMLDWTQIQEIDIEGEAECPDFYPLAVDGDINNIKWVLCGAIDRYVLGSFDGREFKPETEVKKLHYGENRNSYAAQSWSDTEEDGRRIRISWNAFVIPLMPFSQSMTFPCEMKLKTFSDGVFLCAYPVIEIEKLYGDIFNTNNIKLLSGEKYLKHLKDKLYDINLEISGANKASFDISVFGLDISCSTYELKCLGSTAPLEVHDGITTLRLLIDKTSVEIYINSGKAFMSLGHIMDYNLDRFEIKAVENEVMLKEIKIAELNSIWE